MREQPADINDGNDFRPLGAPVQTPDPQAVLRDAKKALTAARIALRDAYFASVQAQDAVGRLTQPLS